MEAPVKEKKSKEKPQISDPWELMSRFYESDRYKKAYSEFFEGKRLAEDVTEKEKEKVFLESSTAKEVFINFATKDVVFKYLFTRYSRDTQRAVSNYARQVKDSKKLDRTTMTGDQILTLGKLRRKHHVETGDALVKEGIAPTGKIGRAIASLILVEKGLESIGGIKVPDIKRIERSLAGGQ